MIIPNLDQSTTTKTVVPQLTRDSPVIASSDHVWFIAPIIIVDVIHAFIMGLQAEVRDRTSQRPDFDGMIQTSRSESLRIFRVYRQGHNIVCMAFEDLPDQPRLNTIWPFSPVRIAILCPSPNI